MIHAVRMGDEYVLTDRGVPVGRIVPFRPLQQWVPAREVRDLLATPSDPGWAAEVREARDGESPRDPWERR
jgi:antitoxin (DNA-binding transcriptional repressor) of toxin-antitoxin stability system